MTAYMVYWIGGDWGAPSAVLRRP